MGKGKRLKSLKEDTKMIIDPNSGKVRQAKDIKICHHMMPDDHGDPKAVKCVEYTVVGRQHTWTNWARYEVFTIMNPAIIF